MATTKDNAVRAAEIAEKICTTAWARATDVIGYRKMMMEPVADLVSLRERANRRATAFAELKWELKAAEVVVAAPSSAEVEEMEVLLGKVEQMALADAAASAGMALMAEGKAALDRLNKMKRQVQV